MLSDFDRKVCQKHKLEILTIDLQQSTADEDKFHCIKCLMEKIDISNMALVEETKIMKQMKSEQFNNKIKENQIRIQIFKQIESQVKELKVSINNTIDKLQSNLTYKITQMENQLNDSESKTMVSTFEEDVRILSKITKDHSILKFLKNLSSLWMIILILIQQNNNYNQQVIVPNQLRSENIQKNKNRKQEQRSKVILITQQKEEDPSKTPSLKIQCNKHGQEIIMFNLNPDETELSRLACVECIQANNPIKYTTLGDANFKWNEYLGQTSDQIKRFQNQRYLRSSQIIDILQDIKEKYNSTLSEIINKVNTQYSMFYQNEINEFNGKVIFK